MANMRTSKTFNYAYKGKIYSHKMFTDYTDFAYSFKHSLCFYDNQKLFYPLKENCYDSVLNFAIDGKIYGITNRITPVAISLEGEDWRPFVYSYTLNEQGIWIKGEKLFSTYTGHGTGFVDITYSPKLDLFCIAGLYYIYISKDGIKWENVWSGGNQEFYSIAWNKGLNLFCACGIDRLSQTGQKYVILESLDGKKWHQKLSIDITDQHSFMKIIACNDINQFLIRTIEHTFLYSGNTLEECKIGKVQSALWCEHLKLLIVIKNDQFYLSKDAIVFHKTFHNKYKFSDCNITYSPKLNKLVIIARYEGTIEFAVFFSSDGTSWTTISPQGVFLGSCNNFYWDSFAEEFKVNRNKISKDGIMWQESNDFMPTKIAEQFSF